MININELAAVIFVLSADTEKTFQRFLFTVWKAQEGFVWGNPAVNINTLETVKIRKEMIYYENTTANDTFPQY